MPGRRVPAPLHPAWQNRNRFWYIEDVELQALFPLFMAWARTMGSSLRQELATIGLALHENRMDEVSRGIQCVPALLLRYLCLCLCPGPGPPPPLAPSPLPTLRAARWRSSLGWIWAPF